MQNQYHAIGETAGKIFKALEKSNQEKEVKTLQKEIDVSNTDLFNQALGWLARETKINFDDKGKNLKVSLTPVSVQA